MVNASEMNRTDVLRTKLEVLRQEHRDLDMAIDALAEKGADQLAVQRLKKKKLQLKDQIAKLQDLMTPDIIA